MHAIVNYGPLAISVDASGWSPYSSGIANPCNGALKGFRVFVRA